MTSASLDTRPRGGFGVALLGGVLLLLLGVYGGWLLFGPPVSQAEQVDSLPRAVVVQVPVQSGTTLGGGAVRGGESSPQVAPTAPNGSGNGGGSGNGHTIAVTGVVSGSLGPGSPATLLVTITNPNNQDVVVTSVTASVTSVAPGALAGKPACSLSWYHVGSFSGSRTVAKNSSATIGLPLTFTDVPSTNQDNCKGASYTYSFTAQARQA